MTLEVKTVRVGSAPFFFATIEGKPHVSFGCVARAVQTMRPRSLTLVADKLKFCNMTPPMQFSPSSGMILSDQFVPVDNVIIALRASGVAVLADSLEGVG